MQAEMDDATQLVNSIISGKAIDVDASLAAMKRMETALGHVFVIASRLAAEKGGPPPVAVDKAEKLISSLNVKA